MDKTDIPEDWAGAADAIRAEGWQRVMLLGAPDLGKSTLARYLADRSSAEGRQVAVVDADAGQKLAGPPATVTLAVPSVDGWDMVGMEFVGDTSPGRIPRVLVAAVGRLTGAASGRFDLVLVNTSGFVAGLGRRIKTWKIEAARPDALIGIERGDELGPILADHPDLPALRLRPSPQARRKSQARRRANRREAFARYFADAATVVLASPGWASEKPSEGPTGLLCGIVGPDGADAGLARLVGRDPDSGALVLRTPVPPASICGLKPGRLRIDDGCHEIG